ncbi:hypothetical protein V070_02185 [Staphylococcus aureus C0673]|uniref:hypothetical protein n=1 Tax=Mammaliicoccus sciuri TaxID=1296 RepID=UPI00044B4EB2|nr:hypothetical protein [Mammaliicoccus sciuri]EZX18755.1 hypothetical protein V070_02185 [Staphylococcus aureus C0673]MDO0952918.1 hypothetical protein [Mammaliicoccus sciuri]
MDAREKVKHYLLDNKTNNDYWYASRHDWRISSICHSVSILQEFHNDKSTDFEKFYEKRKKEIMDMNNDLNMAKSHKSLINADYLGLTNGIKEKYANKKITNVFNLIEKKVNEKFENVNSYMDIIEMQMEKMYLQRRQSDKKRGVKQNEVEDSNILVHPLFVLYKVLLTIQIYTNKYEISMEEFKIFVCHIKNYNEVYKIIEYILISRLMDKDVIKETAGHIDDIRIHLALKQIETLDFRRKSIKLNNQFIDEIRRKVFDYEKEVLPKMNRENMDRALYDDKNIFEFYKGV